jgi:hypothetical protein
MRIRITKPGIFGAQGEIPVGTEIEVKSEPTGWAGRYDVISGGEEGKTPVVNPAGEGLKAVHRGGGSFSIMRGDEEVAEKLTKADADAFNAMSDEDKAAYVAKKD